MPTDLSVLGTTDDGVTMELRHPVDGSVLMNGTAPVSITLTGEDSAAYRRVEREQNNRRLKDLSRGRKRDLTDEELEASAIERLAACTVAWHGIVLDGDNLACTELNARRLYGESRLAWVREQVNEFVRDRRNFLLNSGTTSSPTASTSSD